ncbi:MAG TPA: ABC-ATPase domain-containing protein [Coleofasciculaceae cyanobacterium]
MLTSQNLHDRLMQLDQRGYKAYQEIQGFYDFSDFILIIDHVQGDPFAAPSRLRVQIPQTNAQFPPALYASPSREIALRDYLTRQFHQATAVLKSRGSGKSGLVSIARPTQQVLERNAVLVDQELVEARFGVGLPARGRTILGRQAAALLCEDLPRIVRRSLFYPALDAEAIQQQVETVEDADWLRQQLAGRGLVAFVPDGAILPRRSGVQDQPLPRQQAALFQSPAALQVQFDRPHQGSITGMGIPPGITLIVGGGYHGKSTLLRAMALGIYNHIPGDGREQVVTDATAVKIRAEDGRSIVGVDISPFINRLPQGRSTQHFSSADASGSTSQAANIMEALEVGAKVLLLDEDTSATNFMIRDRRMQALIAKDKEPITPLIDKIRSLYQDYGVSTILVMGGSGDYFDVADTVIAMQDFQPQDVTAAAKQIAATYAIDRLAEGGSQFGPITARIPRCKRLDSPARQQDNSDLADLRSPRTKVRDVDELVFGTETVDLAAVEQIADVGQLRAIGAAIRYLQSHYLDDRRCLAEIVSLVMTDLAAGNLDILTDYPQGDLALFRDLELAAVINRLRSLEVLQQSVQPLQQNQPLPGP